MNSPPSPFTGGLYAWRREPAESLEQWVQRVDGLEILPSGHDGWGRLLLTSPQPLMNSAPGVVMEPFAYDFLVRKGAANRFLLLSNHKDLPVFLIERASLTARIYRPEINIHGLVSDLATHPGKYSMGAVWARIEGQGLLLRTVGLYGDDLGESELFRRLLQEMQAFRVTLRDVVTHSEIISIGSRGEIEFDYSGPDTLVAVDSALHFLTSRSYLKWDIDSSRYSA